MRNRILCGALAASLIMGCQREEESPTASEVPDFTTEQVLTDLSTTRPILVQAMATEDVSVGRSMLESEGYSFVDTNSLVMILNTFEGNEALPKPSSDRPFGKQTGGRLKRADTMVWLAFENPTSDPANHTALLWGGAPGHRLTVLVELDVSTGLPVPIRNGKIVAGQYQPGDQHELDGWWSCVGMGLMSAAWRCAFANCGWGHCAGIYAGGTLVVCTAAKIFGMI